MVISITVYELILAETIDFREQRNEIHFAFLQQLIITKWF